MYTKLLVLDSRINPRSPIQSEECRRPTVHVVARERLEVLSLFAPSEVIVERIGQWIVRERDRIVGVEEHFAVIAACSKMLCPISLSNNTQ